MVEYPTVLKKEFDSVEECLAALARGEIIVVTDDEDRENEGDCICAARFATSANINFMATHAKGLICMPMSREWCRKLDLKQQWDPRVRERCKELPATAFQLQRSSFRSGTPF